MVTPADAINQAISNGQPYNGIIIGAAYGFTILFASFIYLLRLWTNRTVLAAIPKTFIPIEKGDVNKAVRKMIVASLSRSVIIAWDSRPRIEHSPATIVSEPDMRDPIARVADDDDREKAGGVLHKQHSQQERDEHTVMIPPSKPVWGEISHNGWASPLSPDLPNLQFTSVILELPHLIEARAVSVAPPDPESTTEPPMPDLRAVDLLQRPASMGLRDYIGHLVSVDIITSPTVATEFLNTYEHARFSSQPISEHEFRELMKQFAELLRSMQALTPAILASLDIDPPESDIDADNSSSTTTPRSQSPVTLHTARSRRGSEGTIRTAPSRRTGTNGTSATQKFPEFNTAPATPRSKRRTISRSVSANSFAQSRRPYNGSSGESSTSLASSNQGSVIRLNTTNEDGQLPYTLTIPRAQ